MGFLDDLLEKLPDTTDEDQWNGINRAHPGTAESYELMIRRFRALGEEDATELPDNLLQQARQHLSELARVAESAFSLTFADPQAHTTVTGFVTSLQSMDRWWRSDARLHMKTGDVDVAVLRLTLRQLEAEMRESAEGARTILEDLRAKSGEAGARELASYYVGQSERYAKTARLALGGLVLFTAAAAAAGLLLISTVPPSAEWTSLVPDLLARTFAIGALSYAAAFSSKIYRTNTHLRAVYDQKANALLTFPLFSASLDDGDSRTLVLAELVRAVFSPADTGLVSSSGDVTVVESAAPIISALSRQKD